MIFLPRLCGRKIVKSMKASFIETTRADRFSATRLLQKKYGERAQAVLFRHTFFAISVSRKIFRCLAGVLFTVSQ